MNLDAAAASQFGLNLLTTGLVANPPIAGPDAEDSLRFLGVLLVLIPQIVPSTDTVVSSGAVSESGARVATPFPSFDLSVGDALAPSAAVSDAGGTTYAPVEHESSAAFPKEITQPETQAPAAPDALPGNTEISPPAPPPADGQTALVVPPAAPAELLQELSDSSSADALPPSADVSTTAAEPQPVAEAPQGRPSLPQQIHDRVIKHFAELRADGRIELEMNLHPAELGRMRLQMALEENELHVRMSVEEDATVQVMEQQLAPLRDRLAEMGVHLVELDVRRDGNPAHREHRQHEALPPAAVVQPRRPYARTADPRKLVDVMA